MIGRGNRTCCCGSITINRPCPRATAGAKNANTTNNWVNRRVMASLLVKEGEENKGNPKCPNPND